MADDLRRCGRAWSARRFKDVERCKLQQIGKRAEGRVEGNGDSCFFGTALKSSAAAKVASAAMRGPKPVMLDLLTRVQFYWQGGFGEKLRTPA